MQTGLLCPPQTPATVPKLTLATVYNPPHTIRPDIKVRETYLYFLWSKEKKKTSTGPSASFAAEAKLTQSRFVERVF